MPSKSPGLGLPSLPSQTSQTQNKKPVKKGLFDEEDEKPLVP